jgi:ATP-dependent RNA helicase DBP3
LCIYGGVPKDEQRKQLKKGVQIVIGCPGRLLDLMDEGCCDLSKIGFVVLDEADRMLDMGFEREVRRILAATGAQKQTVMFSATWPQSIVQLANEFLSKPVKVTVGSPDLGANRNITQLVEVCDPREKDQKLLQLLERYHSTRQNRVLVFALYKKEASRVHQMLLRKGYNCAAIHGDMNQPERTRNFNQFKSGQVPLLIATDVAARVCI